MQYLQCFKHIVTVKRTLGFILRWFSPSPRGAISGRECLRTVIIAFILNKLDKFKCPPEAFVVHDSALVDFLESIIGGVGKNSAVKAEFFMSIRVMPDLNIFSDSPPA